jgi:hypothetical protein
MVDIEIRRSHVLCFGLGVLTLLLIDIGNFPTELVATFLFGTAIVTAVVGLWILATEYIL